jgi:hypothetical protein
MSDLVLEVMEDALRQPVESSRQTAADETDMSALAREFELHAGRHLGWRGECMGWQKGIVLGIEQQRRQPDSGQPGLARGTSPVVVGTGKTVQRCGDDVVELP